MGSRAGTCYPCTVQDTFVGLSWRWTQAVPLGSAMSKPRTAASLALLALCALLILAAGASGAFADDDDAGSAFSGAGGAANQVEVSAQGQRAIGLRTARAVRRSLERGIEGPGRIEPDSLTSFEVTAPVPARISRILVRSGDRVSAGQPLAELSDPALGQAQSDLITGLAQAEGDLLSATSAYELAQANWLREQGLLAAGSAAQKDAVAAKSAFTQAAASQETARTRAALLRDTLKKRLLTLGISEPQVARLLKGRQISDSLLLKSPGAGIVTLKSLSVGQNVAPTDKLLTVTDTRHFWAVQDVFPSDLDRLHLGEPMEVTVSGQPSAIRAPIDYVGTVADPVTHAVTVRATLVGTKNGLKPGMFVDSRIVTTQGKPVLVIPTGAIFEVQGVSNVWIQHGDTFVRKPVQLGDQSDGWVEVRDGIDPDDTVVTLGAYMLQAQALKGASQPLARTPDKDQGAEDSRDPFDRIPRWAFGLFGLMALVMTALFFRRFEIRPRVGR